MLREPLPDLLLRLNDAVRAHALEHPGMQRGQRLADDLFRAELLEHDCDEDARLDVRADGHDAAVKVAHAERGQNALVLRVSADSLRDAVRDVLYVFLAVVEGENLMSERAELARDRPAEAAETDYQKGFHCFLPFIHKLCVISADFLFLFSRS